MKGIVCKEAQSEDIEEPLDDNNPIQETNENCTHQKKRWTRK